VNVIPLFEDMPRMYKAHDILMEYLIDKNTSYQRVFLARSDPALNYGLVSAVMLNKIALMNLHSYPRTWTPRSSPSSVSVRLLSGGI
jgi:phosphoenolpyruvate carboxylase